MRHRILLALTHAETLPTGDLIEAIEKLPPHEGTSLLVSHEGLALMRQKAACELLAYLVGQLDHIPSGTRAFHSLFTQTTSRCPAIAGSLRAVITDPKRSSSGPGNAAALLGVFRDPADIPLLLDIL